MKTLRTRKCPVCGESSLVQVTHHEYEMLLDPDLKIQEIFPDKPAEFRELLISGAHRECWNAIWDGVDE